jgi:mannose-6-phosphate isomerase-like protein (cupin superfamily)
VTRREVSPGGQLSLQSAPDAAEVWVVAAGSARVTMDGSTLRVPPGGTLTVPPAGDVHVVNEGTGTLIVICVRHGDAAPPPVGDAGQREERS